MTQLERKIKAAALWTFRKVKRDMINTTGRYYRFISTINGKVFDLVTYDKNEKIIEIEYDVNIEKGIETRKLKFPV